MLIVESKGNSLYFPLQIKYPSRMDFFAYQEHARKLSHRMVGMYILAVVAIGVTFHTVISFGLSLLEFEPDTATASFLDYFLDPMTAGIVMGVTFGIIFLTSFVKSRALSQGGGAVAESMGGRLISSRTQDLDERRLMNIVEEMAVASGVPMPKVYVLDHEFGMNAFAAGHSPDDAAVAVTFGLLIKLNREELQAVIAHEFSHILNGDMRLNIRLIGILFGIFALTVLGRIVLQSMRFVRGSRNKKGNGIILVILAVGLTCLVVGSIGFFFGRLMQSYISRQREYLADASAVQFTRNPIGLADALKRIGGQGSAIQDPKAMEIAHMLFASGLRSAFATHPPLDERIRRWDPGFDGNFATASNRR